MQVEQKKQRWQFSLRDVCLLMAIIALALSWWMDRSRLAVDLERERALTQHIHAHAELAGEQNWFDQALIRDLSALGTPWHQANSSRCATCHTPNSGG